ncbi:hypothetical protein WA538_000424 [Blastocystis sp. DL]
MSRGSCPDLDKLMNESNNHSESWLSAFNKVVKNRENASKTVSLGVVHTRPGIESIFGGNTNPVSDGIIALTHQSRSIICNGHNILALSREDIVNMSLSDAHETLFQLRVEGNLMKKGFKRLRMWKLRYFILSGKILSYWEVGNHNKLRHQAEITSDCVISMESLPGRPFSFTVLPSKTDRLYIIDAVTQEDRDMWIQCIQVSKYLVQRINSRPTLRGIGNIYDHFSLGQVLGKGRYGVVRLAECNDTLLQYAVKIINKKKVNHDLLKHELIVLRSIKSRCYDEHLVSIHEIYEDDYLIHIVMELLAGGDLYERITQKGRFTEPEAARVIRHIGGAIRELHRRNILHLDVKPENVIFVSRDPNSDMKLADFGCCLVLDETPPEPREIVGTVGYMAPEVISQCNYTEKADVYSLGVLLYILLAGYPPYRGDSPNAILLHTLFVFGGSFI